MSAPPPTHTPPHSPPSHPPTQHLLGSPPLQRVWMFGPKRVGPNMLLSSPSSGQAPEGGSLFDVPAAQVSKLSKQAQHGRAQALGRPAEAHEAEPGVEQEQEQVGGQPAAARQQLQGMQKKLASCALLRCAARCSMAAGLSQRQTQQALAAPAPTPAPVACLLVHLAWLLPHTCSRPASALTCRSGTHAAGGAACHAGPWLPRGLPAAGAGGVYSHFLLSCTLRSCGAGLADAAAGHEHHSACAARAARRRRSGRSSDQWHGRGRGGSQRCGGGAGCQHSRQRQRQQCGGGGLYPQHRIPAAQVGEGARVGRTASSLLQLAVVAGCHTSGSAAVYCACASSEPSERHPTNANAAGRAGQVGARLLQDRTFFTQLHARPSCTHVPAASASLGSHTPSHALQCGVGGGGRLPAGYLCGAAV